MRIFQRAANASLLLDTLQRYREAGRFLLHGFVVMPDHAHLIFSPTASLEQTVGIVKGGFSFAVRKQYRGDVWQDGYYSHRIVDTSDFQCQLEYVAANPARRCLENYPFVHTRPEFEVDTMPPHLGGLSRWLVR